jgi:drug/metabolite transporter (DMT)-like permease
MFGRAAPWLVMIFVSLMASATFVMIKYLLDYVSPFDLLLLQFAPVSIFCLSMIAIFYRREALAMFKSYWWYFILREALAVIGYQITLDISETVLPAGVSAIIVGIWPVLTIFLAASFLGEKLTLRKLVGGMVAFIGATSVIVIGAASQTPLHDITSNQWLRYSLLLLIAPVSAAVVTLMSRWYMSLGKCPGGTNSILFTFVCRSPGGFFALIAWALTHPTRYFIASLMASPALFWILIAIFAFYNSLIGFWLWNWALRRIQAGSVASFSYVQTLFTLVIAWIFLGEDLGLLKIMGAAAIVIGVLIANIDTSNGSSHRHSDVLASGSLLSPPCTDRN